MNKNRFFAVMAALAAFTMSSCSVQEQEVTALSEITKGKTVTVNFTTSEPETKTVFSEQDESTKNYPVLWTSSDNVIAMSLNFAAPVEATVNKVTEVSNKADFTASFVDDGGPYVFYALSPVSAASALSESRAGWTINVPTVQTPTADGLSCDESAMILYSVSDEYEALPEGPVDMHFSHALTYCRLGLKNLDAAFQANNVGDAVIRSVDVTFPVPVAGSWYLDAATGALEEKESSHSITLRPSVDDLSETTDIWFSLVPGTYDGQTIKISVMTDKGTLSREFTYGSRTYNAGAVNKLTLDMTKGSTFDNFVKNTEETVYKLVTSVNDLAQGDEIIFVNDATSRGFAMTATTDGTSGIKTVAQGAADGFEYSADDGYIRLPASTSVGVYTVASKNNSSLSFQTGNNYLGFATSGYTRYLSHTGTQTNFTVSITNAGAATVSARSTYNYYLYYNNNHFTIRTTRSTCAIYKKTIVGSVSNTDPDADPIVQKEQFGSYLASGNTLHVPGTSQISRQYGSDVTFALLFPAENSVVEFKGIPLSAAKGDKFTLVLDRLTGKKKDVIGTFDVTVVKEDGPKLWLSDFKGNGFIVKR